MDQAIPPAFYTAGPVAGTLSVGSFTGPQNLVISCGKGNVSISLNTGKVTLTDCTPDEGAARFWYSVERMFPLKK